MVSLIAVYMQENDVLVSFLESQKIVLFEMKENWMKCGERQLGVIGKSSPSHIRHAVREIVQWLGDCTIIAGQSLTGIPYNEFNKYGLHIFDIRECNEEILDDILQDVEMAVNAVHEVLTQPVQTSVAGIYQFNLATLQDQHPEISSKAALAAFLKGTPFLELQLICKHIPPWMERGDFQIKQEETGNGLVYAVISKKQK